MERPEKKERRILLCDSISRYAVDTVINKIIEINDDDDKKEELYKNWGRDPIMLFINSRGGCVYDGLALVDMIKQSTTPVYTIGVGSVMSMALWVWLAGEKRYIGEHAPLMFHDVSGISIGKTEELIQDLNESKRLQKLLIDTITNCSDVTEEKVNDYITRKAEWFITPKEAKELKLADDIFRIETGLYK